MKIGKAILVVTVLAAAGGGGWWWWQSRQNNVDQPTYEPVTVQRGDISVTIEATASVVPENRVEIKPSVSGRMEEVLVEEGAVVKKGQVLGRMSSTDRAALIDAARARGPAEVARWEDIYKPAPLIAPLDGTVILRNVEPGQTITPAVAVLVLSDHLILAAQVDETDLAQIRLDQVVQIVLDAYPQKAIPGRISSISYEAKTVNNVTTYTAEIRATPIPPFVRSGMTAVATFLVAARTNVLYVTAEAVRQEGGHTTVLVPAAGEEGQPPQTRDIKTGLSDGKRLEVLSGLAENETVLIKQAAITTNRTENNPFMPKFPSRSQRHSTR